MQISYNEVTKDLTKISNDNVSFNIQYRLVLSKPAHYTEDET